MKNEDFLLRLQAAQIAEFLYEECTKLCFFSEHFIFNHGKTTEIAENDWMCVLPEAMYADEPTTESPCAFGQ